MGTVTAVVPAGHSLAGKKPINNQLWHRLVDRIVTDLKFQELFGHEDTDTQHHWAERIMDQALGFLQLCALEPDGAYAPSACVDIGWHTFILHTREYAVFCQKIAGHFIHHLPADHDLDTEMVSSINTAVAMKVHRIFVDDPLWWADGECQGQKCYSCTT